MSIEEIVSVTKCRHSDKRRCRVTQLNRHYRMIPISERLANNKNANLAQILQIRAFLDRLHLLKSHNHGNRSRSRIIGFTGFTGEETSVHERFLLNLENRVHRENPAHD